jgi:hypothetical protein
MSSITTVHDTERRSGRKRTSRAYYSDSEEQQRPQLSPAKETSSKKDSSNGGGGMRGSNEVGGAKRLKKETTPYLAPMITMNCYHYTKIYYPSFPMLPLQQIVMKKSLHGDFTIPHFQVQIIHSKVNN